MPVNDAFFYDDTFYDAVGGGSLRAARAVVPLVMGMVRARSVIDFGCGQGAWLRAFRENGAEVVLGLDGPYVDRSKLHIGRDEFCETDLTRPVTPGRRSDLAVCLEVGEHLPTRSSGALVGSLTSAAPVVLFSAAVPGQGGTHHINEQWPEFWDRLFAGRGYLKLDLVRPQILRNRDVEWWYRQNIYLYATGLALEGLRAYERERHLGPDPDMEVLGADVLGRYKSFRGLLRATFAAAVRSLKSRSSRLNRRPC